MVPRVVVWAPSGAGHRFAYAGALLRYCAERSVRVVVLTSTTWLTSAEYDEHLAPFINAFSDAEVLGCDRQSPWRLRQQLKEFVSVDSSPILLVDIEADRRLHNLLLQVILWRGKVSTIALLTRPPSKRWVGAIKFIECGIASVMPHFELVFLEEPLLAPEGSIWPAVFRRFGNSAHDFTATTVLRAEAAQPSEVQILGDSPFVLLVGAIDRRKRVRLILDAWQLMDQGRGTLVIAGRVDASAASEIGDHMEANVIVIDRYLADGEIAWLIVNARLACVLHEDAYATGTLQLCASAGTPAAVSRGSLAELAATSAKLEHFAVSSEVELAGAFRRALAHRIPRRAMTLPSQDDFAGQLLSDHCGGSVPSQGVVHRREQGRR